MRLSCILFFVIIFPLSLSADVFPIDSLGQITELYKVHQGTEREVEYLKAAYNFMNNDFRKGKRKEVYKVINDLIEEVDIKKVPYMKARLVDLRSLMAGRLMDEEQLVQDQDYLKNLINSTVADSVKALAASRVAYNLYRQRLFTKALPYYDIAVDTYKKIEDYSGAAKNLSLKAISQSRLQKDEASLATNIEAEKIILEHFFDDQPKREELLLRVYNGISNVVQRTGDFSRSNEYLLKAAEFDTGPPDSRATILTNICINYTYLLDFENAEQYCKASLDVRDASIGKRVITLNSLIRVYVNSERPDSAVVYLKELEELSGDPKHNRYSYYLVRKADVEYALGQYEESRASYEAVYEYHLANEPSKLNSIRGDLEGILKSDLQLSGMDSSLLYFNRLIDQIDTLNKVSNAEEVLAAAVKYEADIKQLENERLKLENTGYRYGLVGGGLLLLALGFSGWNWRRNLRLTRENAALLERERNRLAADKVVLERDKLSLEEEKLQLKVININLQKRMAELALSSDSEARIMVQHKRSEHPLMLKDIVYVIGKNNLTTYHLADGSARLASGTFINTFAELPQPMFMQTGRTVGVNLSHIAEVKPKEILMSDGAVLPLSRRYRDELRDAFVPG